MKLALVTAFPPSKTTLNEYGYHLAKHFAINDEIEELILITDRTEGQKQLDFEQHNCKISVKDCWSFNSYKNIFSIYRTISKAQPDAILFNLQFMKFGDKKIPAALGLLLPLLFRLKGIPTIVLLHNILEQVDLNAAGFTANKMLQKLYNLVGSTLTWALLQADVVAVTMSKYVEVLEQKYKRYNIVQIPHGSFETPPLPDLNLPSGAKKIMAFGKFGTYKKVEILIEAVAQLRKEQGLDLEVVIAGTDSPNTPGYLEAVKDKFKNVPKLTFTGYVQEEDVPRIFTESAVVVFPYTSTTGSSGVLHQAGSYGKAVIMPNLGDLALLVQEEGYAGEFFEPEDVESLKNAIKTIALDDDYRKQLGRINYKAACSLPMSKVTQLYIKEFEKLRKSRLSFKIA